MTGDDDADPARDDLAARVRRDVDRRLDRLEADYGPFPIEAETVTNDPDYFAHGRDLAREGWRGDAGAIVADGEGRVLLIRHEGDPERWGTPGGGHEPGERFEATARREVREETGVDATITGVARARRRTIVHESDPDRRLAMLTVEFEAEADRDDDRNAVPDDAIGDAEILEARWFDGDDLPDALRDSVASVLGE